MLGEPLRIVEDQRIGCHPAFAEAEHAPGPTDCFTLRTITIHTGAVLKRRASSTTRRKPQKELGSKETKEASPRIKALAKSLGSRAVVSVWALSSFP